MCRFQPGHRATNRLEIETLRACNKTPTGTRAGERPRYCVGARRFTSSNQCCTTTNRSDGAGASAARLAFVIRNRWPSGAMSYRRPGTPGTKKAVVSKSFRGGPTANVDLLVGETRIKAPIDS